MPPLIHRSLLAAAGIASVVVALDAPGQTDRPVTSIEIAQLPRFCWAQLQVPNAVGDEFKIQDCGPAANHYCGGLVYLMRAKSPAAKGKPVPFLLRADTDIRYTERGIKDYPKCSIREHVANARAELNHLLRMYGSKPGGAQ